jgi:outer membrane receptor protein involved in Fe transport
VALVVNNLFDKRYIGTPGGQAANSLGTSYSSVTPPRYVGVILTASM